jgi:hypothetical protein
LGARWARDPPVSESLRDIRPREHMNDVLILLSGARVSAEVVTENAEPFTRWAALLRRMGVPGRVREVRREDYLD